MKRLIAAIAGLCLLATSAIGFYQSRDSNYNQNVVSGGGGFTGILDIASIPTVVMAFGVQCPKSSYTGNLVDVFSISLATTKATLGCSAGGTIVVKSGTWTLSQVQSGCTATHDCVAIKLYDKSGALACTGGVACDMAMTSTTSPYLVTADGSTNCGSGATFANAGTFCLQTNLASGAPAPVSGTLTSSIPQPIVYMFTAASLSTTAQADMVYNTASTVRTLSDNANTPAVWGIFAGSALSNVTGVTEAQWHTFFAQFNGASSCSAVDNGACVTTNPGAATIASGDSIGYMFNTSSGSGQFFGFFGDLYVFKATITGVQSTVYSNEKAFWGGGMP